jgi:hypothetical protein
MNNVLTVSRMLSFLKCPRQHFWRYEVGLQKATTSIALKIGSAWARGMEARWDGKEYTDALACAVPLDIDMSDYDCQIVAALLAGYYEYYSERETVAQLHAEVPFHSELEGTPFVNQGVLDGLGSLSDGRSVIVESKTTGDSVDPNSDYWMRLRFNMQVLNYVLEARKQGWDISAVFYDVTRKPSIRPKEVSNTDSKGRPIVLDQEGNRVLLKTGKDKGEPKKSANASKGEYVKSHIETPDEFSDRLYNDTKFRPEFYYARREVAILDSDLAAFEKQRIAIAGAILHFRQVESSSIIEAPMFDGQGNECGTEPQEQRDESAWPRNVSENTCDFCQFKSFCLQNIPPTDEFKIQSFNPELERQNENAADNSTTAQ